uniref:ATP-grasp enzyme-like n=1 Tax=Rheinheimera sp. BAL341 TaxID=1708203 RepID=A0A486XTG7_9GAMM
MTMSNSSAALVIGLCSHGLAVTRALAKEGVTVFAVEQNDSLPGTSTNSVTQIFPVQSFTAEDLVPALLQIRQQLSKWDKVVLMPTNDNHVKIVGEALDKLLQDYLLSWSACATHILNLQKKDFLEPAARQQQVNYPKSIVFNDLSDVTELVSDMQFPMILKPVKPMSSFKTLVVPSPTELAAQLENYQHDLPIVGQEYIAGGDNTLYFSEMLLDNGEVVQNLTGRKVASHPPARGQATIAEIYPNESVAALAEQFVAPYNLSGPVAVEFKMAPDGSFWLIEPTVGRTEFLVELIISAGYNQPYQEFLIALGLSAPSYSELTPSIWFDCERAPLNYVKTCWEQKTLRPFGKKPAFTYFALSDIRPFLKATITLLKRVIFK